MVLESLGIVGYAGFRYYKYSREEEARIHVHNSNAARYHAGIAPIPGTQSSAATDAVWRASLAGPAASARSGRGP